MAYSAVLLVTASAAPSRVVYIGSADTAATDLRQLVGAFEAERRYQAHLAQLEDLQRRIRELPDPRDLYAAPAGVGRLRHAFDVMPRRTYRGCAESEPRAPGRVPIRRQIRRDRWPGGERRSRPRATFRARFCSWRRSA